MKCHIEAGETSLPNNSHEKSGLMMRFIGPITTFVNKPWKVRAGIVCLPYRANYPADVPSRTSFWIWWVIFMSVKKILKFRFYKGFDTASSIALLAITALAKKGTDANQIGHGDIVILPVNCIPRFPLLSHAEVRCISFSSQQE